MFDIHTHILPCLDDGAQTVSDAVEMLNQAVSSGVTDVVFTPHYRGDFNADKQKIISVYNQIKPYADSIGLNTYIGQEITYDKSVKDKVLSGELLTLNGTNCLLLEFDYFIPEDIAEVCYSFNVKGYVPIVAHIERYNYCLDLSIIEEIKSCGGKIQVNSGAITGKMGGYIKKFVYKLIKLGLVDFVASDVHSFRPTDLKLAYETVQKKFGNQVTEELFINNAKNLIIK